MPDTPVTRPITLEELRRASDACCAEIVSVLTRHRPVLGELGNIHVLIDVAGSLSKATIDLAPQAKPLIVEKVTQLLVYVETAGSRPQ